MEKNQKIKACLKLPEINAMLLKEKNSSRLHRDSNSFPFQTHHVIYFLTPILKGPFPAKFWRSQKTAKFCFELQ